MRASATVPSSASATAGSLRLVITCSGACLLLARFPLFCGPKRTFYLNQLLGAGHGHAGELAFFEALRGDQPGPAAEERPQAAVLADQVL